MEWMIIGVFVFSMILSNWIIYTKILKPVIPISKKGMTATGTLIQIDRVRKSKSVAYYPVVKYKTLTGRYYEGRTILSSKINGLNKEEPVEIIYNPDKEEDFVIQKFFNINYYYFILIFSNILSLGMLIYFLFVFPFQ